MSTEINIKKKLAILDEGASVTTDATSIDFVGAGVTAATVDGDVIITIPGGLTSAVTSVATAGLISGGTITSTGTISTSMSTNKLVGRYSASTGIMEEVTIGSGLTLTGAGTLNNTATPTPLGYYGAFSDVTDQFAAAINTGYPMLLGVTDLSNQVTVVSGSRVTIANTGIYNIQWSAQFRNPTANIHDVTIWLRKNGVDVPGSSGIVAVTAKHGIFDGHILPSWNFLIDPIAGDYYEFVWSTTDTSVFISFEPAGSPPPSTASVVLTVTQQSGIMAGTGITAINSLTGAAQTLTTGTTGTDFAIVDSGVDHKFNLPTASATNRGALSSSDWSVFDAKQNAITLTTTGTSGAATLVGSTLNVPNYATSTSGIVGIANSSGVYTYYATLSLAMTAAVSGNTIELFADIVETGSVAITLKSGVNINGNGHTYTLSVNDGTNALTFALSGTVELYNLKVVRTGRTVGTGTGNVLSFQDGNAKIKCFNASFLNDFGYCCVGMGIIYNAHGIGYLDGMYDGLGNVRVYDSYFESTGTGTAINTPVGFLYNSTGRAVSGNGITSNGEVYECTGISTSGIGISAQRITNCTGISTSGTGLSGEGRSCVGISTSGIGGSGTFYNSTLISSSNYGATATLYNSYTQSSSSVATNSSSIYNSTVRCLWNNIGGHCTSTNALGTREILNSFLEVTNASAYCITGYPGSTWKYASNVYKGSTTAVNSTNIIQGITNTSDNQGNILI